MKKPRVKKVLKIFPKFWLMAIPVAIFCLGVGYFVFFYKPLPSIYIYPEKVKQGDSVFIRVKTQANQVVGNMGEQKLIFYKSINPNEWISLLGIDADQAPGDYKIFADTSNAEHLEDVINIGLADFSTAAVASAPNITKDGFTPAKAENNIVKNDNPSLKKILSKPTSYPYFTDAFMNPLGKVEKTGFSFGRFIGFAKDKIQHLGVDLRASKDTEIYAVNDGRVVGTLNLSNYGKTIIIDHGLDIFSLYLHLDKFKVAEGDMVKRGQNIGLSGDTGYVTAPHLHFSMRVGASRVDPLVFIETSKKLGENYFLADLSRAVLNILSIKR